MSLLMFDYDGVIVDSYRVHVDNFVAAFHEYGFYQVKDESDIVNLYYDNVYAAMEALGLTKKEVEKVRLAYDRRQALFLDQIKPFPGIKEALEEMKKNNTIVIITANSAPAVRRVLACCGMSEAVDEVIGAETETSKTKRINTMMEKYAGEEPYYIGDTVGDIKEGRAAGAKTVGVAWGWHGDKLLVEHPDYYMKTPAEMAARLAIKHA